MKFENYEEREVLNGPSRKEILVRSSPTFRISGKNKKSETICGSVCSIEWMESSPELLTLEIFLSEETTVHLLYDTRSKLGVAIFRVRPSFQENLEVTYGSSQAY